MTTILFANTTRFALFTLSLALFASMFAGCYGDNYWGDANPDDEECLTPEGGITSKTTATGVFTEIQIAEEWGKQADVTVEKGERYEVTIEGRENLVEAMAANTNSKVLKLEVQECFKGVSKLKVFITVPALERLHNLAWGANIQVKGFEGESLSISNDQYAELDFNIHYKTLKINSTETGRFTLTGQAEKVEGVFRGFSSVKSFGLETKEADITSSTTSDIEVKVTEQLTARITNSGNILYKGRPTIHESISGTGKVIDAN